MTDGELGYIVIGTAGGSAGIAGAWPPEQLDQALKHAEHIHGLVLAAPIAGDFRRPPMTNRATHHITPRGAITCGQLLPPAATATNDPHNVTCPDCRQALGVDPPMLIVHAFRPGRPPELVCGLAGRRLTTSANEDGVTCPLCRAGLGIDPLEPKDT